MIRSKNVTEVSADPVGNLGARMALLSCPKLKQRGQIFVCLHKLEIASRKVTGVV